MPTSGILASYNPTLRAGIIRWRTFGTLGPCRRHDILLAPYEAQRRMGVKVERFKKIISKIFVLVKKHL